MRTFLVLASFVALAAAQYDYSPPQQQFPAGGSRPTYGLPNQTPGIPQGPAPAAPAAPAQQQQQQEEAYTPQVFRHVYVHVAPDEPEDVQSRTIRVPGGDKHVNIIFVKTPSQDSSQQTEVILPEQDEHKNLVYVLLKKGESTSDVKIRKPAPARQQKPEVYFIKYNNQQQQQQGQQQQQQQQGGYQQQAQQAQPQRQQQQQQQQQNRGYQQQSQSASQAQQQNNGGYEQAPAGIVAPAPIRTAAQVPSSGYGLPL